MRKILIPEYLWVGSDPRQRNSYLTAWGTDSVSKRRMDSVTSVSGGKENNCRTILNEPLVGFRLLQSVWKDSWRLQDPRGFEFTINNNHLQMLFDTCVIQDGVILDACVYARVGSNNAVLSTRSDVYSHAVWATRMSNSKETWRKVKPGNHVVLRSGVRGQYLGKYYIMHKVKYAGDVKSQLSANRIQVPDKAYHVILEFTPHQVKSHQMHLLTTAPLAQIEDNSVALDAAQAEIQVNQYLQQNVDQIRYYYWREPLMALPERYVTATHKLVLTQLSSGNSAQHHLVSLLRQPVSQTIHCRLQSGELVQLSPYHRSYWRGLKLDEPSLLKGEYRTWNKKSASGTYWVEDQLHVNSSQISEILEIHMEYETALGNKFHVLI
jgi:hypothetical protein